MMFQFICPAWDDDAAVRRVIGMLIVDSRGIYDPDWKSESPQQVCAVLASEKRPALSRMTMTLSVLMFHFGGSMF